LRAEWLDVLPGLPLALVALGLCLGSFLNVVIHRLPRGGSLWGPRSQCPHCGETVAARDNLPVLSYILLRGRCRHCSGPISIRYPVVELLGALCMLAAIHTSPTAAAAAARVALLLALVAVFAIDLEHRIIPDAITLPALVLGLAASPLFGTARLDAVIGAVVGAGGFWLLGTVYRSVRGVEGLGGGDVKLAGALGACLGWQGVVLTMMLGSLAGSVVGGILIAAGRAGGRTELPYGAFLAPAAAAAMLWGPRFWAWYLAL